MDPVIANKAIKVATTPEIGIVSPISKPKTRTAPINPNTIPNHCFQPICSFNKGPAKILVRIGCSVTINAAIPVGIPLDIEKNTT